jgi:hypothetical protein
MVQFSGSRPSKVGREMSRKRVFAGAENWKTLAGRVAWYYGKITDLQITAISPHFTTRLVEC